MRRRLFRCWAREVGSCKSINKRFAVAFLHHHVPSCAVNKRPIRACEGRLKSLTTEFTKQISLFQISVCPDSRSSYASKVCPACSNIWFSSLLATNYRNAFGRQLSSIFRNDVAETRPDSSRSVEALPEHRTVQLNSSWLTRRSYSVAESFSRVYPVHGFTSSAELLAGSIESITEKMIDFLSSFLYKK